jgi:hypothetical protein
VLAMGYFPKLLMSKTEYELCRSFPRKRESRAARTVLAALGPRLRGDERSVAAHTHSYSSP